MNSRLIGALALAAAFFVAGPAAHASQIRARVRGVVNGIDEHLAPSRSPRDLRVHRRRRRGNHEPVTVEIGRAETAAQDARA